MTNNDTAISEFLHKFLGTSIQSIREQLGLSAKEKSPHSRSEKNKVVKELEELKAEFLKISSKKALKKIKLDIKKLSP